LQRIFVLSFKEAETKVVAMMLTRPEHSRSRPRSRGPKAKAAVPRPRPFHNANAEDKR